MKRASAPVRTCVGCGRRDAQARLVRLQVDGSGAVNAVQRVQAGRSAYVHAERECVAGLIKSRGFRRSLRRDVPVEARRRCAEQLGAREAQMRLVDGAGRS